MILTLLKRELKVARRNWIGLAIPLLFFIIVVSLFPFAVSPEAPVLQKLAPGVIWVAALLAMLLSLEQFYRSDYQDGSLEQLLLMSSPTSVAISKILAHWLLTGLPLVILSPLLAVLMQINYGSAGSSHTWVLMLSLVLGTPTLCAGCCGHEPHSGGQPKRAVSFNFDHSFVCANFDIWGFDSYSIPRKYAL